MKKSYFSFNKISLIKSKKYKNNFERKIVEVFSDEKGDDYLVSKNGEVYKLFDELSE